ncbi:MAG: molybdopterin-dependent oxidoreductase [Thaumarchaeota archaeon]|nr:molybdopterin-dependent oxidoreductase [Candidatus Calditenuaceae archaeon]MDW8041556.1 molybdopterin-dependent oxidoreductase [Nitrososphaerota archaeon]
MQRFLSHPPQEKWDDWEEYDPKVWPRRVKRRYLIVPTVCFNCEAGCGLLAYVDRESLEITKLEGNPFHPTSRGRNCAKGPASLNQFYDPERIPYPLKREEGSRRGEGRWVRVSWDEAINMLAERIRKCIVEGRLTEVMYHVGRPGEDGFMEWVLQSWGVDGRNSHTNVCSSSARAGYALIMGADRPCSDFENARFILLLSDHLESGHYFNPHAQRIIDAKKKGAKIAVIDVRLSNTAAMADYWIPCWPGTEAALLLGIANVILQEDLYDREFLRRWVNWKEYMMEECPDKEPTFENFIRVLKAIYSAYSPEFVEKECGVPSETVRQLALEIARAGGAFSSHTWRSACAGNLGGWQVSRALVFLHALTGSIGTVGGMDLNVFHKFVPRVPHHPEPQRVWSDLLFPKEFPLSFHEMSFILPHMLLEGRGKLSVYMPRAFNPIVTYPDGFLWSKVLTDEEKIGFIAALTPFWNETAWYADLILPVGTALERHDLHSYESYSGIWIGFRQPINSVIREKLGKELKAPAEVMDEAEFWIELSWRIDPDGKLGIRKNFESPYRPGEKITADEFYRWIFENSVPGLKERAREAGMDPLSYMRRFGAYEMARNVYMSHETPLGEEELRDAFFDEATGVIYSPNPPKRINMVPMPASERTEKGWRIGVVVDGKPLLGFPTPSRRIEFYSRTLKEWGWPEYAIPSYVKSHVHHADLDRERGEFVLVSTMRVPTQIHTRSNNAKWLTEISHKNPIWMNPQDAAKLGVKTGDLIRVTTEIGYFVSRVWVTSGVLPGVIGCTEHFGRFRVQKDIGASRIASSFVETSEEGDLVRMRVISGIEPFESSDPDTMRIWWKDGGVPVNLTFPVQPDPVSGQHVWHQRVRVEKAQAGDRYGDVVVNLAKSMEVYRRWMALTRPPKNGMRRPLWLLRPFKPHPDAYRL